jgi:DNA invertase Pin-like site-specific DNA recombinase
MSKGNGKQLRAGGYSRTSGEGQRDNTSIPVQHEGIEGKVEAEGWVLVRHYTDECISGAKVDNRAGFKRMLADAAAGELDVVVPFDAKRFARDGVDIVHTAKFLKANFGICTVDAKGQFDNRDHRNALRNFVEAGVSEHERLTIMERTIGGRVKRAKAGLQWSGEPPVGRQFVADVLPSGKTSKTSGTWSVTEQGRRIAQLLQSYLGGKALKDLAKEYGFSSAEVVMRWVRDGQLSGGSPDHPYVVTFNAPEIGIEGLRVPVPAVPSVISQELEADVRAQLEKNRTWNKEGLRKYLLSSFVRCGHCNLSLTGKERKGHRYYRHHWHEAGRVCPFGAVRADVLEGPALDYLYAMLDDEPAFNLAVRLALPDTDDREERSAEVGRLQGQLAKVEKAIDNLVDAVAAGVNPSLLLAKQGQLVAERDALRQQLAAAQGELAALPDPALVLEQATEVRSRLRAEYGPRAVHGPGRDWRQLPYDDVRRFLRHWLGDNARKEGLGIFVRLEGGQFWAEIKARLWCRGPADPGQCLGLVDDVPFEYTEGDEVNQLGATCKPQAVYPAIPVRGELRLTACRG